MAGKTVKFYDIQQRKAVLIPASQTKLITKKGRNRTVKMLTAIGKGGNKLYKIVG